MREQHSSLVRGHVSRSFFIRQLCRVTELALKAIEKKKIIQNLTALTAFIDKDPSFIRRGSTEKKQVLR